MRAAEFAGQAILHALVAALAVEALIRLWRVRTPDLRLGFRFLVLAFPIVILPAFLLLAPQRREEWFKERWALFSAERWGELALWGVGLNVLGLAFLSALGVALFLLDFAPFLAERLGGWAPEPDIARDVTEGARQELEEVAGTMRLAAPPLLLLESPTPLLFCTGVLRPRLVLSRPTLESLDAEERRAALAHELGHLARRDPLLGWILLAARVVMVWNPVVQVVARAAVQETEWRADDLAVQAAGHPATLAGGLIKLSSREAEGQFTWWRRFLRGPLLAAHPARARAAAVEKRCRRLLDEAPSTAPRFAGLRMVLTGLALSLLLFFVV